MSAEQAEVLAGLEVYPLEVHGLRIGPLGFIGVRWSRSSSSAPRSSPRHRSGRHSCPAIRTAIPTTCRRSTSGPGAATRSTSARSVQRPRHCWSRVRRRSSSSSPTDFVSAEGRALIELESDLLRAVMIPTEAATLSVGRPDGPNALFHEAWGTPVRAGGSVTDGSRTLDWLSHYRGGWQVMFPNAGAEVHRRWRRASCSW